MASPVYQNKKPRSRGGDVENFSPFTFVEPSFVASESRKITNLVFSKKKKTDLPLVFKRLAKIVDPVIKELLFSYVERGTQKMVGYQVSTGGKRVRPGLAIISCRLLGGRLKDVLYPAAGLEILHNYTLIVDDIIDHSILRRQKPTVWYKFGTSMAECVGIDYAATLFQAANYSKNPTAISELFAKTLKTLVEGEIRDILFEQSGREDEPYVRENRQRKITKYSCLKMISQKTAVLFQACCELGAICAKAENSVIKALKNYGLNLGIAFQIQDDILDIFGEEEKFGKKIGKDIEEKKGGNIVTLLALEQLDPSGRKRLTTILAKKKKTTKRDISSAIALIRKTEAKEKAQKLAEKYINKAKKSLQFLPQNKWNNLLRELADFVIEREK